MKKRILLVLICVLALAALVACGGDTAGTTESPSPSPEAPAETPTPEPAADENTQEEEAADNADDTVAFDFDRPIAVITREDGSGTRDAFVDVSGVGDDMSVEAAVFNSTGAVRTAVAENELAIAYVSVGSLNDEVRAIAIDGVYPSDETVRDGSYALQRRFLLVVTDESQENPLVQDFIDFVLSAQGQALIESSWTAVEASPAEFVSSELSGSLTISGSTSVAPAMELLVEAYENLNPDVTIDVMSTGSGTGIEQATTGVVDIGMSSRELRDGETDALNAIPIVLDGVAVIVNIGNPLPGLTMEQLRDIFVTGTMRWSDVES